MSEHEDPVTKDRDADVEEDDRDHVTGATQAAINREEDPPA